MGMIIMDNGKSQLIYDCINIANQKISQMNEVMDEALKAYKCKCTFFKIANKINTYLDELDIISKTLQNCLIINDVPAGKTCEQDVIKVRNDINNTILMETSYQNNMIDSYITSKVNQFNEIRKQVIIQKNMYFFLTKASVNYRYPTFPTIPYLDDSLSKFNVR